MVFLKRTGNISARVRNGGNGWKNNTVLSGSENRNKTDPPWKKRNNPVSESDSNQLLLATIPPGSADDMQIKIYNMRKDVRMFQPRSEERRVGKECRSRWWPDR